MSYYYSGLITWDQFRTEEAVSDLVRAMRLAMMAPGLKRPELIKHWCMPVARSIKGGGWLDGLVVIRCYGNYAYSEMHALADAISRVTAIREGFFDGYVVTLMHRGEDNSRWEEPIISHYQQSAKRGLVK